MIVIDFALMELFGPSSTPLPVVVEMPVILTAPLFATIGETPQLPFKFPTAIPALLKPLISILPVLAVKPAITVTAPQPPVLPPELTPLITTALPAKLPLTNIPLLAVANELQLAKD